MSPPELSPALGASPSGTVRLRAPLCGREHELELLQDALNDALAHGAPHTLALIGGAGMGKSRLMREFLADVRVQHEEVRVLASQCREGGDPYGVIRSLLRSRFALTDGMDVETTAHALREAVSDVIGDRRVGEFVHFLGAFLDVDMPGSPLAEAISDDPEQVRQLGRSVLKRFLEADAAKHPLVIALDDFHLAHADAAGLVHYLVRTLASAPVLFVVAARPELLEKHPEWLDLGGNAIRFDLAPLNGDDAATMVEHLLAPTGQPPDELVDEAVAFASGNPYLLEQIVRTFIDEGVILPRSATHWEVDLPRLAHVKLPLSIEDAIQARISGLSQEERGLLEMAAALGGVFWLGALVALERAQATPPRLFLEPNQDRTRISALLEDLAQRDYVMRLPDAGIPGETEYAFKHNLEREALHRYTSRILLVRHHRVVAQWLELRLVESSEEQHEFLAQHFELGGVNARAAHHYLLAADRARARHAAARAAGYYARGLSLLGDGEASVRLRSLERWGDVLQMCGQSEQALRAFEDMRVLAYQLDLPGPAAMAHARIGRVYRETGQLVGALEHLDTAQALYESVGDDHGGATTLDEMASLHLLRGHGQAAEHLLREALSTFERLRDDRGRSRVHLSMGIAHRNALRPDAALVEFTEALSLQRAQNDEAGSSETLMHLGALHDRLGAHDHALVLWNEALQSSERLGDRTRTAAVLTCLGGAAYRRGAHEEAITQLSRAADIVATLGDRMQEADTLRSLAKARALAGDLPGATSMITRAMELVERAESRPQLAVALRTRAEIMASTPGAEDPAPHFERAIALHEELGQDFELARALLAFAEHLGRGTAEHVNGRERAVQAERMRQRARELLDRHKGLTLRLSVILPQRA